MTNPQSSSNGLHLCPGCRKVQISTEFELCAACSNRYKDVLQPPLDVSTEPTCPTCGKGNTGLSVCSDGWHLVQPTTDIRAAIADIIFKASGGISDMAEQETEAILALLNTQLQKQDETWDIVTEATVANALAAERAAIVAAIGEEEDLAPLMPLPNIAMRTSGVNQERNRITNLIRSRDK